jgi:hypothetical protein
LGTNDDVLHGFKRIRRERVGIVTAVAEYTISWDSVCEVIDSSLVADFNEKMSKLAVAIKLSDDYDLEIHDCLIYYCGDKYSKSYKNLEQYNSALQEIINLMKVIFEKFKEKTNIHIYIDLVYSDWIEDEEKPKIILQYEDVVELTPKAKSLHDLGITFCLDTWTNDDY